MEYKHSWSLVGANKKHIQLTPKYRYKMMRQEKLKTFCKVAVEEACTSAGIKGYPTWVFSEGNSISVELSLQQLGSFTNCPLPTE